VFLVQLAFLFVLDKVLVLCICFCIYLSSCICGVARCVCGSVHLLKNKTLIMVIIHA